MTITDPTPSSARGLAPVSTASPASTAATADPAARADTAAGRLPLPAARGPVSEALLALLTGAESAPSRSDVAETARRGLAATTDILRDEDLQLTLLCLYELHYRGIAGVADDWEWDPALLGTRALLEDVVERELRLRVDVPPAPEPTMGAVAKSLFAMTAETGGPSLSRFVARDADEDQLRELLVLRSLYQLKEADPHTWAIPRLAGAPKAALVEIQTDEYGGGDVARMHASLYATTMRGLGLDDTYGAYVDSVPALFLASLNMMSLFGLHRRLRGAIVGHLAAFEMTSSIPNRLYGNGFRRVGHDGATTVYFDEHVEADAVHEQIAGRDLAGRLAQDEPALLPDILFGAAACLAVDGWAAEHLLDRWTAGGSALRDGAAGPGALTGSGATS